MGGRRRTGPEGLSMAEVWRSEIWQLMERVVLVSVEVAVEVS